MTNRIRWAWERIWKGGKSPLPPPVLQPSGQEGPQHQDESPADDPTISSTPSSAGAVVGCADACAGTCGLAEPRQHHLSPPPIPIPSRVSSMHLLTRREQAAQLKLMDPESVQDPGQSFFPCPVINLVIDQPSDIVCQICHESHLELEDWGHRLTDDTFAILPCGHAAGHKCLRAWFRLEDSCPFCRMVLRYPICGHKVLPRLLTSNTVHVLPRTLPDGGALPPMCLKCVHSDLLRAAQARFERSAEVFRQVRARALTLDPETDTDAAATASMDRMLRQKQILENLLRKGVHEVHIKRSLHQW